MEAPYLIPFPCRINENQRIVHCDSCERIPLLLARIKELEIAVDLLLSIK